MSELYGEVQRIVLRGSRWEEARQLVLGFGKGASPRRFLHCLKQRGWWPTAAAEAKPDVQVSLGFSRRGLEHAGVPDHVLTWFALKSPAFFAGAALRASSHLGASGREVPGRWDPAFAFTTLDAVLSLHGMDEKALDAAIACIRQIADATGVQVRELVPSRRLQPPPDETTDPDAMWVHFGYRDGLAHVGIEGSTPPGRHEGCKPISQHAAGEFLLGRPQTSGANPWIAGPGLRVWPQELRSFFHNGSFGVLNQIEQNVAAFEQFVAASAEATQLEPRVIKAKLCGRYTDGRPLAAAADARPEDDFDYEQDADAYNCPFGAHVRRMNPRGVGVAHAIRARPLLRRGMPYGPPWWKDNPPDWQKRGLMAQFFCASIEDQFEHLVGQWADQVPLGSADRGGARDPLIGAHEAGDGVFEIPVGKDKDPIRLKGLRAFTRTVGLAYLFYPSLQTLLGIAMNDRWYAADEDEE